MEGSRITGVKKGEERGIKRPWGVSKGKINQELEGKKQNQTMKTGGEEGAPSILGVQENV